MVRTQNFAWDAPNTAIALRELARWQAAGNRIAALKSDPLFRRYVVFLVNSD